MKEETGYNVIKPAYYDKFACIMSACEDNCCNTGWKIFIDKNTYDKYKSVGNPEFRQKVDKYISLAEKEEQINNDSFFYHAKLVTAKDGFCPFQTRQGLCEIHRDYGEEFLSITCKSYPRNTRRMTDGFLELSVSMSCPEAVRAALFDESPMEFIVETVQGARDNVTPVREWRFIEGEKGKAYLEYGWDLREAAITIMQERSCPVAYRIIIIAMMLHEVAELHDGGRAGSIPEVLEYYCTAGYGDEFVESFSSAEENELIRLKMNTVLYYTIRGECAHEHSTRFAQIIKRFDKLSDGVDLGLGASVNAMEFYIFVKEATGEHWGDFLREYEHVLENYLVNYMFTELFPMMYHGKGLDPYHHTLLLAEQYAILRILLCGNYDPAEGFSMPYIVQTITQVAVLVQHSSKPLIVVDSYKNAGISSPAHLYYMLL